MPKFTDGTKVGTSGEGPIPPITALSQVYVSGESLVKGAEQRDRDYNYAAIIKLVGRAY